MNKQCKRDIVARLCYTLGEDDGVDPRVLAKNRAGSKNNGHKIRQLCKEAGRVISLVLMDQLDKPLLCDLQVVSVEPEHNGQNLCVTVAHVVTNLDATETEVVAGLKLMQGLLRCALAQLVNRKRTPSLSFRYAGFIGEKEQGGFYAD